MKGKGPNRITRFAVSRSIFNPAAAAPDAVFPDSAIAHAEGSATITPFLYVCDSGNDRIQVTDFEGNFLFAFGGSGSGNGQFSSPYGVTTDGNQIYVTDTGNNRVETFDLYGNYVSQFGSFGSDPGQFDTPKGIATDGRLLVVVDQANNRFQIFTIYGALLLSLGTFGSGTDQFNAPTNCAVDDYYIKIDDTGNNRRVIYAKAFLQAWAAPRLPMRTMSGTFYGHWWQGAVTLPMRTMSGVFSSNGMFTAVLKLPMRTLAGTISAKASFVGSVTLPMRTAAGTFSATANLSASLTLPMRTVDGTVTARGVFSADIKLPMRTVAGILSAVLAEVYHAISVNTELFAVTEYTNYPFNSTCEFNGKYYASGPAGVTRLDGSVDLSNTPIVPVVRFGTNDLHKGGVKSFVDSYFTGDASDKTSIKYIYDEDEANPDNVFTTSVPDNTGAREAVRVKPPQGMKKKRFITAEITGAQEVDNLRLIIEPIPGRVR